MRTETGLTPWCPVLPLTADQRPSSRRREPGGAGIRAAASTMLVLSILTTACSSVGQGYDALALLRDVRSAEVVEPRREAARFRWRSETWPADLYRARGTSRGALLVVHGFTRHGRRDPQLVRFAAALARRGFSVLAPEMPSFRRLNVSADDASRIVAAFRRLSGDQELAPGGQAGIAAVSLGVGPALLAAKEPTIAGCVSVVVAVGGYYDLPAAVTYMTTGYDPLSDDRGPGPPRPEAKWLVLHSQLEHVPDPQDRELLRAIAEARMADPSEDVTNEVAALSAKGRDIHRFVTNRDPDRVASLWRRLPSDTRRELAMLDLSTHSLAPLRADLLLIHGSGDSVIPVSHSRALKEAVPEGQAALYEVEGLQHMDVRAGLWGSWQLWRAAYKLLSYRGDSQACGP